VEWNGDAMKKIHAFYSGVVMGVPLLFFLLTWKPGYPINLYMFSIGAICFIVGALMLHAFQKKDDEAEQDDIVVA
jgi:hypothetical protein